MSKIGNLLRKVSHKLTGGVLGTASGDKPGTGREVGAGTSSHPYYDQPNKVLQTVDSFNSLATQGLKVSPMVIIAGVCLILFAFLLRNSKNS